MICENKSFALRRFLPRKITCRAGVVCAVKGVVVDIGDRGLEINDVCTALVHLKDRRNLYDEAARIIQQVHL